MGEWTMDHRRSLRLTPDDAPDVWRGCVAWTPAGSAWRPWRLPPARLDTAFAPALGRVARMAAGVRAAVRTDARKLTLEITAADDRVSPLDVLVDGELWARRPQHAGSNVHRVRLPAGTKDVEVWLPQFGEITVGPLTLDGTLEPPAAPEPRPRWITYGSSITHCDTAPGPSETWPALVARALGWDLTCLGVAGQCHLDTVAAQTIAEAEADLVSLCLGINVYGAASYGPRTLPGRVAAFVGAIRERHPRTPLAVISPIVSPAREDKPNAAGMTLADVRDTVASVARALQRLGDRHLQVIDGRTVLGARDAGLLPDGLHPGPEGYRLMAERLTGPLREAAADRPGAAVPG